MTTSVGAKPAIMRCTVTRRQSVNVGEASTIAALSGVMVAGLKAVLNV